MPGSTHLRKVGSQFLAGGLTVVASALIVVQLDQVVTGGRGAVVGTCMLFFWAGAIAAGLGLLLRMVTRPARRTTPSPFSPQWRPPPVTRMRSKR